MNLLKYYYWYIFNFSVLFFKTLCERIFMIVLNFVPTAAYIYYLSLRNKVPLSLENLNSCSSDIYLLFL